MMLRWLILWFLLSNASLIYAESFSKLWGLVSYFGHYEKILYSLEPQIRLVDRPGTYEQSLLNAAVGTKIRPQWQIWFGQTYTNYSNFNNTDEDVSNKVLNEYRIWQQALWRKPFWDTWASRLRLEQRHAFESSRWAWRVRERLYWTTPVHGALSLAINDELFINLNAVPWVPTSTLDQNRFYVGGHYLLTPTIGLNVSYMNQYIAKQPAEVNNALVINLIIYA